MALKPSLPGYTESVSPGRVAVGATSWRRACDENVIQAFKTNCRAPILPNAWNRWLLVRGVDDNPTLEQINAELFDVLTAWFSAVEVEFMGFKVPSLGPGIFEPRGKIDNVKVVEISLGAPPATLKSYRVLKSRQSCSTSITVSGSQVAYVLIEFVFRGSLPDMPWPVWVNALAGQWCPAGADWIVDSVLEARSEAAPAPTPGLGSQLADKAAAAATSVKAIVSPFTPPPWLWWGLGAGLVGGGVWYVYTRVRSKEGG